MVDSYWRIRRYEPGVWMLMRIHGYWGNVLWHSYHETWEDAVAHIPGV